MKPLQTLYLLASDHDFRLVHSHQAGMAALGRGSSEDFPDVAHRQTGGTDKDSPERNRLAHHAMAALQDAWSKGSYDRIVLVAGPKMLGDLRHALPKSLTGLVAAELHKDLVKLSLQELPEHLAEVSGV